MVKTGILGEIVETLGQTGKQAVSQAVNVLPDIAKGVAEQTGVAPEATQQSQATGQANINKLKVEEEEKTAANLAITRQRLAEIIAPKPTSTPRPAEKVEGEKRREMVQLRQKEAEKPPPLAIQRRQRAVETRPGPAG